MKPFIQPYQYNYIRNELNHLLQTVYFVGDYRVYEATKQATKHNVISLFEGLSQSQNDLFSGIENVRGQNEINDFMMRLAPHRIPFQTVSDDELRKLFRKVKKLSLPDWDTLDSSSITYLGWRDIASQSLYLVYPYLGKMAGIRCTYTPAPTNRTCICTICHQARPGNQVALAVAVTKATTYISKGNHICLNSDACNRDMMSVDGLNAFFAAVLG